jgi:hypothetical protein
MVRSGSELAGLVLKVRCGGVQTGNQIHTQDCSNERTFSLSGLHCGRPMGPHARQLRDMLGGWLEASQLELKLKLRVLHQTTERQPG